MPVKSSVAPDHANAVVDGSNLKSLNDIPGPKGLPVLGNLLQIKPTKLHQLMQQWSDEFGPIFQLKFGTRPMVVVTGAEAIQHILKSRPHDFRRFGKMDEIMRELGVTGVFNAEGDDWKRQRRLFAQALNINRIRQFFATLVDVTEKFASHLDHLSSQHASIDIKAQLMRYTVDVTSRLAFGYNMNTIEQGEDAIQEHMKIIFPAIFNRINFPFPYWRYFKLPSDKKLDRSVKAIVDNMHEVIGKTRTKLQENGTLKSNPTNFLEALLAISDENNPVSNQEVIGNVLTMLFAGEDTTAHTLTWMFYYLHLHPAVQEEIKQEADRLLGDNAVLTTYDVAAEMRYLEAVAFETMRLKPIGPLLYFENLQDVTIENFAIPKDTWIVVHAQYSAISDTHFSSSKKFIPERWLLGACPMQNIHDEQAFMPFGAGPRYCPGYNLAMLEIKIVISAICKKYRIVMDTDPSAVDEVLAFTLVPTDFTIKLEER